VKSRTPRHSIDGLRCPWWMDSECSLIHPPRRASLRIGTAAVSMRAMSGEHRARNA